MNEPMNPDELDQRLERLANVLLKKRDEAVEARAASGVERRWREDQNAFEGLDATNSRTSMLDYATGEAYLGKNQNEPRRSKVIVNIIRGKCNTAEGRFSEIMLPTDDQNWGIDHTKIPDNVESVPQAQAGMQPGMPPQQPQQTPVAQAVAQTANPVDPRATALAQKLEQAKKRAGAMQDEIADQLEECEYNSECRKVIRSAVRLGTGVLKGPNVVKRVQRAWVEQKDQDGSVYVLESSEKMAPASKNCDVWNIYPDANCGDDPKHGAYLWEKDDHMLPRDLRALIGVSGYSTRQIRKVLEEEPKRTSVQVDKGGNQLSVQHTTISKGAPYERWEYHGDVDRADLEAMGCTCPDDDMQAFSACAVFVNDRPIKAVLNTLDTGELPYDFFQWEQVADSPWGIGEPRKIIWQQRIITAAWRAMMDNAGDSAGSQIVISSECEPDDGVWDFSGKKIWVVDGEEIDVRKAFAQHQITNNQQELQNIIELALKFTDMESGTPMLAQGEKGSSPETLGGMQLLMQGADTTRRRQVKQWDDQITRPHIGRYYHWNMQYNKNPDIKGDFEVDARGTSVLLVKDQAGQALSQVFALRQDPEVNILVDWEKAVRQLFEAHHLDVMKTDEQIVAAREAAAKQQPPVAPQVQVAQIRAEVDTKKIEAGQQETAAELRSDWAIAQLEALTKRDVTADELKVDLASIALQLRQRSKEALAGHTVDLHKHSSTQANEALQPLAEAPGRAPAGQAFAR